MRDPLGGAVRVDAALACAEARLSVLGDDRFPAALARSHVSIVTVFAAES